LSARRGQGTFPPAHVVAYPTSPLVDVDRPNRRQVRGNDFWTTARDQLIRAIPLAVIRAPTFTAMVSEVASARSMNDV